MIDLLMSNLMDFVKNERLRSNEIHGTTFVDDHQAYAVILEEYEEALYEFQEVKKALDLFWEDVKNDEIDSTKLIRLRKLWSDAYRCAAEVIQLCGVIEKATDAIFDRREEECQ